MPTQLPPDTAERTRDCRACGKRKPLPDFHALPHDPRRRSRMCKDCHLTRTELGIQASDKRPKLRVVRDHLKKRCTRCHEERLVSEFFGGRRICEVCWDAQYCATIQLAKPLKDRLAKYRKPRMGKGTAQSDSSALCLMGVTGYTQAQLGIVDSYMAYFEAFVAVFNERVAPGLSADALDGFHAAVADRAAHDNDIARREARMVADRAMQG